MSKALLSSQDVLNRIGASSFRNISKDQLISFVSSIPDMDKETAIKCIEQFPEFKTYASGIVSQLQAMCINVITDSKTSRQDAVNGYMMILDTLKEKLSRSDISLEEVNQITRDMVEIADKIALLDSENKHFLEGVLKAGSAVAAVALAIAGGILGVKIYKK